jgi:hypothetical protein
VTEAIPPKTAPEAHVEFVFPSTEKVDDCIELNVVLAGTGVGVPVVAEAGPAQTAEYEAMNRETKPTKAREITQRFGIAMPSIGILLKVSFCKILLITYPQSFLRDHL